MTTEARPKIILIDGNSLLYRAFFALPTTLSLPTGQAVNGVYGFTSMLIRLCIDEQPAVVVVAFDSHAPTFRHQEFAEYKAHRQETPSELISQFPLVKEVLSALRIPSLAVEGYEADDILATLARLAEKQGREAMVVTGDRDAFQLIDNHTRVMTTRKGISDIVVYDRDKVIERYGIPPEKIPDFLGLKGDSSDNIPGVPGIGAKTAAKLLQQYPSLESIYQHLAEIKPERISKILAANEESARLSKKLATLDFNVPLDFDFAAAAFGCWDREEVVRVFNSLRFKSLLERFTKNLGPLNQDSVEKELKVKIFKTTEAEKFIAATAALKTAAVLGWAAAEDNNYLFFALAGQVDNELQAISLQMKKTAAELKRRQKTAAAVINKKPPTRAAADLKSQISPLKQLGMPARAVNFDVSLAAYLIEATAGKFDPGTLTEKYLQMKLPAGNDLSEQTAYNAAAAAALQPELAAGLKRLKLERLFQEIEMPLIFVLERLESTGIGIDAEYLKTLQAELETKLADVAARVYELGGEKFNLNSPQQLRRILFEKLKLTPGKKTKSKTAYTTDAAALNKLAGEHPIVPLVIEYRELAKLKSTYIDPLPQLVRGETGRLHTTFNQMVTATGRLSSSNPNLQNIPVRTPLGRRIRAAFVPAHRDEKLLVGDYSQIELRLLAHLSKDPNLLKLFAADTDIHTATAAEVFGLEATAVGKADRRRAKAINFGIIYGISAYGLAEQLNISREEAKAYIDTYLERYPRVKEFISSLIKQAYEDGYVTTITGRRRYLPELKSANYQIRAFGERVAVNAPLQGSAADIIKIAMLRVDKRLDQEGLQTRMVLQVHDELVFEVPPLEEKAAYQLVKNEMEKAYELKAPLKVDLTFGRNWDEAK